MQNFQVSGVGNQVHERADRLFRRLVGGNAGLIHDLHALGDRVPAHPGRQDRFMALARRAAHRLGGAGGIGHGLRREDHQHGIDALVLHDDFQGLRIAVRRSIAQHVHRIAVRPAGRQKLVELGDRLLGQDGQFALALDELIGGHHARAAGIGEDRQPVALGRALVGQKFRAVEHVFDVEDAFDARPLENGFIDGIHAGHGPGVRGGGLGRLGESARFEGHDRLGAGESPARRDELPRFGDRFDVEDDRLRIGGGAEIVDQIGHAHVEHIAHRNEIRETDAGIDGPIEHRGA